MAVTVASKGKWFPGTRDASSRSSHWCESCDRQFTSKSCLERHATTELHFKRAAQRSFRTSSAETEDFEQYIGYQPRRSCRKVKGSKYISTQQNASRRRKSASMNPTSNNDQISSTHTHTHCPTCYSKVDKRQMGKHLISHFHCQRTRTARLANPELSLILDHIHDIVVQSPYQCATCKFYFTQKEQLLAHIRDKHLQIETGDTREWNCSACSRTKFSHDGHKLLEHLKSASHKVVESAIAKSIPIIIRQISPQTCPVFGCNKMFILNRELATHVHALHGDQFLSLLNNNFASNSSSPDLDLNCVSDDEHDRLRKLSGTSRLSPDLAAEEKMNEPNPMNISSFARTLLKAPALLPTQAQEGLNGNDFVSSIDTGRAVRARRRNSAYTCKSCDYSTRKKSHFARHIKTHDGPSRRKEFRCTECSSSFFEKGALARHQRIHSGKTVHCPVASCNFVGINQSELKSHSVVHNPPGSFPCKLCKYATKSKIHLNRHHLLVHKIDVKNKKRVGEQGLAFTCDKCTFKTSTANGLKRHSLQHTEESPYLCPYCDVKTKNIENLRTHVLKRQLHAGKHLYKCSLCAEVKSLTSLNRKSFATNKFLEFRKHVEHEHATHEHAKSQRGIFIIAGIQTAEDLSSYKAAGKSHARHALRIPTTNAEQAEKIETTTSGPGVSDRDVNPNFNSEPVLEETFNTCSGEQEVQEVIQLAENTDFEMDSDSAIFVLDNYSPHAEYVHVLLDPPAPAGLDAHTTDTTAISF